jgi:pimeloyl-ACP methyl ester carboxylesterase
MTTISSVAPQHGAAAETKRAPAVYYKTMVTSGRAPVNGFEMYYEIHGTVTAKPLVTIHPGVGTANVFPSLARHRLLIAVELQGHGRSTDLERPLTLEQEADDVAALLKYLNIEHADFFGESLGGVVAGMMAVRHPALVRRVAVYGAPFNSSGRNRRVEVADGYPFDHERQGYQRVALDPTGWPALFAKVTAMEWQGFSPEKLRSIQAPVLIASGDHDSFPVEHFLEASRLIPNAQLAIIPNAGHFVLYSDPEKVLPIVATFLDEPESDVPFGTALTGYHPGLTR